MDDGFQKHASFTFEVLRVGHENIPVIVVDNLISNVETLVENAASQPDFSARRAGYPGVCGDVPAEYFQFINTFITPFLGEVFSQSANRIMFDEANFSVVTTVPEELSDRQRIPHKDGTDPIELAMVHYLCDESFGGTSFYRHRRTGFEYIDASRAKTFDEELDKEITAVGLPHPPQFMSGSSALFERMYSCKAKMNRAIIYPCPILHSGDITDDYARSDRSSSGRLTITGFFSRH